MLLRTEELKHFPSHWFKIRSQSQSPPRKVVPSISFLSDSKYGKWSNQDLSVEPICCAPTVTDCHGLWVGVFRVLNTGLHTLHYVNLLPETGGSKEARPSVGLVRMRTRIFWRMQPKLSSYRNTGHEHSGEGSFLLFPCQMKHRAPSLEKERLKKKPQNQQVRVKHLWRWSAHSKGQRGSVSLVTAPGWLWWFNTPSSAKGTHILSVYKSYSGVQAWESLLQI